MKHHRRLIGILQQQLLQDIDHHGQHDEDGETGERENGSGLRRVLVLCERDEGFEDTHDGGLFGGRVAYEASLLI